MNVIKKLKLLLIIPLLVVGGISKAQNITPPSNLDTTAVTATTVSLIWNSAVDTDIPVDTTALSGDGSMYVNFSSNLLTNVQNWAVEFRIDNYASINDYVAPIGDGSVSDLGALYWKAATEYYGFVNVSGNNPTNNNTSDGDLVGNDIVFFAYGNGTTVRYYVDGVLVETLTPTSGGTAFTISSLFTGASDARNVADGDIYYLKVWNTPTGTSITEIQAETPDNYFMINEATGNTINDEYTAITGTVINPHANQWVGGGDPPVPPPVGDADTFYINLAGSNSYNGMYPDSAWTDLSYLAARVADNTVGDSSVILLNRGDSFVGTLPMRTALTYSAYGTGLKPIIDGSSPLTNWTSLGGNLYYTIPVPSGAPAEVRFLTINGVNYDKGREPDGENNWYTITSSSGNDNLYDVARTEPTGTYVGGVVAFKESFGGYPSWKWQRGNITAFSGGNFTIGNPGEYGVGAGYPYFITDCPEVLDNDGEWAYTTDTLLLYSIVDPATRNIRFSSEDILANIDVNGVTIDNLTFQYANLYAIFMDQADNSTIQNSKTERNYVGIFAQRSEDVTIYNDTVLYSTNGGILAEGGDSINISYNFVNHIADNYTTAEDLPYGSGLQGIVLRQYNDALPYEYVNRATIYRNDVWNTGAAGIYFVRGGNTNVIENTMINCVQNNNDAGSLYTWKMDTIAEANVITYNYDSTYVYRNYIGFTSDSLRFKHLWSNDAASQIYYGNYGFYFDDWSSNIVLRENMTVGTRFGTFLHSGWNNLVDNNYFVGDSASVEGVRSRRGGGSTTIYSGTDETYLNNIATTYGDGGSSYNVGYYGGEVLDNFYFSGNRWVLLNDQGSSFRADDNIILNGGAANGVYTNTEWNTLTFANTSNDVDVDGRDLERLFTFSQSGLSDIDSVVARYYNTSYDTLDTTVENLFGSQYFYTDNDGLDATGAISIPPRSPYVLYRSSTYLGLTPPDTAQVFTVTSTKKDTITVTASNFDVVTAGVTLNYDTIPVTSRISGNILANNVDTSLVSGDYRVYLNQDDVVYVSLWHRNGANIWATIYNSDTAAVDTAGAPPAGDAVTDDFSTDYSPLGNSPNWTAVSGTHVASSGRVYGDYQYVSNTFYSGTTFSPNQYAQVELDAVFSGNGVRGGVMVRHNGGTSEATSSMYYVLCWGDGATGGYELFYKDGETYNQITSGSEAFVAGDVVKLEVSGTTLRMYRNDVQFGGDQTDSNLSTGWPGIVTRGATSGALHLDNFEANGL